MRWVKDLPVDGVPIAVGFDREVVVYLRQTKKQPSVVIAKRRRSPRFGVAVTVSRRGALRLAEALLAVAGSMRKEPARRGAKNEPGGGLGNPTARVLAALADGPLTTRRIAKGQRISGFATRTALARLLDSGLVRRDKRCGRGGGWEYSLTGSMNCDTATNCDKPRLTVIVPARTMCDD